MKANKKMYPGGGMLRNKYANGGAVDKFRQFIMSNPGVVSLKKSVKSLPKAGMTAEQKSRMSGLRGAMSAMAAQSAGYSPAAVSARAIARPSMATATTPQSRVASATPATMAKRAVTTTATPTTAKTTTATPTTAKTAGASVSFSKAFADARAKGLKEFTWNGKKYTTQIKGGGTEKPQATRNAEPVSKMPMKAVASVTKPYFESPTGVMQPASVKTTEMRGATVQKMPMKTATQVSASTDKGSRYFKPGTMAEYLEERRRKMQSNLMTKR